MKKVLLLISTLILSLLFVNNKVYAQEFPPNPKAITYLTHTLERENAYTYEYYVIYFVSVPVFDVIDENDYFLVNNINAVFRKGINRNTNSYEYDGKIVLTSGYTEIYFRITVLKTLVDSEYSTDITPLFDQDTRIYIDYLDPDNIDYDRGFLDGYNRGYDDGYSDGERVSYNNGYNAGYNQGYTDGTRATEAEAYQRGYNDGARNSFQSKLHIWIVPAIIVVVIAGIFVGYRRERHYND